MFISIASFLVSVILLLMLGHMVYYYATSVNIIKPKSKVLCWPKDKSILPARQENNQVFFPNSTGSEITLNSASQEGGGYYLDIETGYWLQIPEGYIGIISLVEGSFTEEAVFLRPQVLPSGWQGDLVVNVGNRHAVEPAFCGEGDEFVCLTLIENPDNITIDTEL